jgi:hypothetical protein
MKNEYDFSNGEKGKFYKPGLTLNIPIYLDPDVKEFFDLLAENKNINTNELINLVLKNSMELYKHLI